MSAQPPVPERHLAILGPGLLGGSLSLAAKASNAASHVSLWGRRPDVIEEILAFKLADHASTDLAEATAGASLIVLATPVEVMPALAARLASLPLPPDCLITDVGSVKRFVVSRLEPLFAPGPARFLGSHPMAGSEKTGLGAASPDLFRSQNAACILTPTASTAPADLARLSAFWQTVGCRVLPPMSPEQHDHEVARVSHLPHLMAAVTTLAALGPDPAPLRCSGNGFRDTTRVASGDPSLWTGIISQNHASILAALHDARDRLGDLLEILDPLNEGKLHAFLSQAKNLRDLLPPPPPSR
jgi:prephenate dehydrogenase